MEDSGGDSKNSLADEAGTADDCGGDLAVDSGGDLAGRLLAVTLAQTTAGGLGGRLWRGLGGTTLGGDGGRPSAGDPGEDGGRPWPVAKRAWRTLAWTTRRTTPAVAGEDGRGRRCYCDTSL